MFLLFLITVHLNARIPEKLVFWTVSYVINIGISGLYERNFKTFLCAREVIIS